MMGTVVASLIVKVVGQVDDAIRSLNKVDKAVNATAARMKKIGANMASIGKSLTLRATTPLLAFGAVAVNAASDLAESMSAVGTVFGDAAKDVSGFSGSVARDLGLSRQEALQAATTFGAMGKQIGLTGKDLSDFSNGSIQAAADLASFYNAPVPEALAAIQSGLQGEAEPLRRFGIFLSDATLNQYALAKGIGKTTQEMNEQEKIALRQQYIMENLGAAQGDFARTSGGLANQLRIAKAEMMDIAAQLGTILLPYVLQAVGIFREWAQRFADLSPRTQKIIVIVAGLVAVLGPLLIVAGSVATAIAALGPALALLTGPVGLVILALVGLGIAYRKNLFGFATLVNKVVPKIVKTFKTLFAIAKGGKGLHDVIKSWPAPLQKAAILFSRLTGIVRHFIAAWRDKGPLQAFLGLGRDVERFGRTLGNLFQLAWLDRFGAAIKTVFADVGAVITSTVTLVDALIHGRWGDAWQAFQDLARNAVELWVHYLLTLPALVLDIFDGVLDAIRSVDWGSVLSFLAEQGAALLGALYDAALGFWDDTVQPWLNDLPGLIADAVPDLVDTLVDHGRDLLSGLYNAASGFLTGTVLPWLGGIADDILGAMPDLLGTLAGKGADALRGLYNGITGYWPTVKDFFDRLPGRIAGFIPDDIKTRLSGAGRFLLRGFRDGVLEVWDNVIKPFFSDILNRIIGAMPAVSTFVLKLLGHGKSIIGGLWNGVQEGWKPVSEFFGGLATTIANLIPDDIEGTVKAALQGLWNALDWIGGKIETVLGLLKDVGGWFGFGGGSGDAGANAGTGGQTQTGGTATAQAMTVTFDPGTSLADIETWATGVADALEPLAAYVIFAGGTGGAATTSLSLQAPPFKGEGSLRAIQRWVKDATAEFKRLNLAGAEQMRALKANVDLQLGLLKTSATTKAGQVRSGVTNEWIGARSDALTIFETMKARIENHFVGLRTSLDTLASGARTKVKNAFQGMSNDLVGDGGVVRTMKRNTETLFDNLKTNLDARAFGTRNAVVNQFVGMRNDIASIVSGIPGILRNALSFDASGAGRSSGSSFGQGVYIGALSWQTNIYNAGAQLATQLIAGFKTTAGIASPSKVAIQMAGEIPRGAVIGIDRGIGDVSRAGSRLAGAAFGSASGSWNVDGSGVAPVAAVAGGSRGGDTYNFDIDVSVQGGGDVDGLGSAIARAVLRESHVKGKPKGFR